MWYCSRAARHGWSSSSLARLGSVPFPEQGNPVSRDHSPQQSSSPSLLRVSPLKSRLPQIISPKREAIAAAGALPSASFRSTPLLLGLRSVLHPSPPLAVTTQCSPDLCPAREFSAPLRDARSRRHGRRPTCVWLGVLACLAAGCWLLSAAMEEQRRGGGRGRGG